MQAIQSGFLGPLHFGFVLLTLFPLEQFSFGDREHLAHGVVEAVKLGFAGNFRRR